jgi:hypothetical protein
MTAAYRLVAAERKDIAIVTVICECGSAVSLNIATANVPYHCSSCGKGYGENVTNALECLGRFHRLAGTAEEHAKRPIFRFDIKQTD